MIAEAKGKLEWEKRQGGHRGMVQAEVPRSKSLTCPECGSARLFKDGFRYLYDGTPIQRWLCRDCGYRFSEKNSPGQRIKPLQKTSKQKLNNGSGLYSKRQVCAALTRGAKNLATVESRSEKRAAGATETSADVKGRILEFLWWMKKQGYAEATITGKGQILKCLVKLGADLEQPETVKEILATQRWSPGRKANVIYAYSLYLKFLGLTWSPPQIKVPEKLPFIPTREELIDLIAGCSRYVAVALQMAMETGARIGEIFSLKWTDVDLEKSTITITPEKNSSPRAFKMSAKLRRMLENMPKTGQRILSRYSSVNTLRRTFEKQRRKTAFKLGNPRLLRISFHTFRHWKATWEYYKTKDILYVMQLLGHKNIKNTLKYTQLAKFEGEDLYICKVAQTPKEIASLIESGFTYVCEKDGMLFFRKPK